MRYHEKDNLFQAFPESFEQEYGTIEGMDNLQEFMPVTYINTSAQWFLKDNWNIDVTTSTLILMLGIVLLLMTAFLILFWKRDVSLETALLAGFTIMLVAEFFLPAIKTFYFNIMWLVPFSFLILEAQEIRSIPTQQKVVGLYLLFAGLLFSFSVFWKDYNAVLGEVLITLSFLWASACLIKASPFMGVPGEALPPEDAAMTSAGEVEPGPETLELSDTGESGGGEGT